MWQHVRRHRDWLVDRGELDAKRRRQLVDWTRAMVRDRLLSRLDTVKDVVAASRGRRPGRRAHPRPGRHPDPRRPRLNRRDTPIGVSTRLYEDR